MLDLVGQRFGRLIAQYKTNQRSTVGGVIWNCICDCGNIALVQACNLRSGKTESCGCINKERITKHGMHNTVEYATWEGMIQRCTNTNAVGYHNYGGRGITVCDRWLESFENFYADMGPRPSLDHSIDRSDNDGNYEPGNCYWATDEEQANNKRNNIRVEYKGKTYTASQLAKKYSIDPNVFIRRITRGWNIDRAVETPIRYYGT